MNAGKELNINFQMIIFTFNVKKMNMEVELWKDIPEYEKYYQISNFGNVRTKDRQVVNVDGKVSFYKSKDRKPSISEYRMIALSKNGCVKVLKISRIVAKLFVKGKSDVNKIVNHIDGNKHNDLYSNLEWCSHSHNSIHAFRLNLNKRKNNYTGIFFEKRRNKWACYLYRDNKNLFVGRFSTEQEALNAYNKKINDYNSN